MIDTRAQPIRCRWAASADGLRVAERADLAVGSFQPLGQLGDLAAELLVSVVRRVQPVLERGDGRWLLARPGRRGTSLLEVGDGVDEVGLGV